MRSASSGRRRIVGSGGERLTQRLPANSHCARGRAFILFTASLIFLLLQHSNEPNGQFPSYQLVRASDISISSNSSNNNNSSRTTTTTPTTTSHHNGKEAPAGTQASQPVFKLDCQPGEQRQFSYESSTKVWGSSNQQVRLKATLRLKCMEPPTNTTLKYLAEIVELTPSFMADGSEQQPQTSGGKRGAKLVSGGGGGSDKTTRNSKNGNREQAMRDSARLASQQPNFNHQHHLVPQEDLFQARAEPLFEEVGEAAVRMKRSVSGWFSKAWVSVKDFFGNIFTSSERSSVSREQAFKETGLDIASQCKAGSSKSGGSGKNGFQGLPFDESVFEDLGPEYYVGASSLDGGSGSGGAATAYEFSGGDGSLFVGSIVGEHDNQEETLSFFDDPKPPRAPIRSRRAATTTTATASGATDKQRRAKTPSQPPSEDYERLLKIPFVFLQSRLGKIIEVRFSGDESDLSVKNFKRHLCDLFATNLDAANKTTTAVSSEVSPIGRHQTKYTLDSSANSMDNMKQSVIKSTGADSSSSGENGRQLVRVLAMVGSNKRHQSKDQATDLMIANDDEADGELDLTEGTQRTPDDDDDGGQISVLRQINTTSGVQLSSKMLSSDIDRMEVRVKQVQQINEGRMVGTAGQLSMSLLQAGLRDQHDYNAAQRNKRQAPDVEEQQNIDDISELLQVSTSFSMQMVPIQASPTTTTTTTTSPESVPASAGRSARGKRSSPVGAASSTTTTKSSSASNEEKGKTTGKRRVRRRPVAAALVRPPPGDSQELQRVLTEWRKQEARLQLSASNLISETSGQLENEQQRLEVLRDQVRQRLNEEFVRNRIRRSLSGHHFGQQQVAAVSVGASASKAADKPLQSKEQQVKPKSNDLGLGLTQLVLGNGITTKRKGSIYATLEEVLELESKLVDEQHELAISRMMRDTIRMDKLRDHCRSSLPSLERLLELYKRPPIGGQLVLERTLPFGFKDEEEVDRDSRAQHRRREARRMRGGGGHDDHEIEEFERKNERKFEQCRNMLQLMLRLSDRQAVNLVVELIDECNQRLVTAAKSEELGYGPVGKFYRHLRQQLVELLVHLAKPSDSLIDKLLARLYYPKLNSALDGTTTTTSKPASSYHQKSRTTTTVEPPEFVYVNSVKTAATTKTTTDQSATKYNKSLLKDEDDFNNNDGAGQMVMTLTSLAAKGSISRLKRVEVVEKLLQSLKGTACSLFNAPDLDIIEAMGQFQEPLEELASRVLSLARRCKQHDQYLVACIHGLSGQLAQGQVQRFLSDQLKSPNVSCTLKSEILLTLIGAQLVQDLKQQQQSNESTTSMPWPSYGINRVDETLLDLLESRDKAREPDRKCLRQLVGHYMSRKHNNGGGGGATNGQPSGPNARRGAARSRARRAVVNENNFWDESHCKRWSLPVGATFADLPNELLNSVLSGRNESSALNPMSVDLVDEIDDNSIITALLNEQQRQQQQSSKTSRSFRGRSQKLIERELDITTSNITNYSSSLAATATAAAAAAAAAAATTTAANQAYLRRRHKCMASKNFGPRNAQANLKAEIVNDLIGTKDENKFLARFRLSTNFLGNRIDVGRMYLWHQRQTTRAYANILGRSIWDTSHGCKDKAPNQMLYMPLFDFNLWLIKVSVGLRLSAEMGFFSNCRDNDLEQPFSGSGGGGGSNNTSSSPSRLLQARLTAMSTSSSDDELQLFPTIALRAAGEASAKLVVARAGMSLASNYGYQGSISVSRQPDSCMSIQSAHQPMNITFSSWFQLWDNDCHFWGSRSRAEPQAVKWRLMARKPMVWLEDECLEARKPTHHNTNSTSGGGGTELAPNSTSSSSSSPGFSDKVQKSNPR